MIYIVVDDEQALLIANASEGVEIRDRRGRRLGVVAHCEEDDTTVALRRRASNAPRFSTGEVLERLRAVDD